MEPSAARKTNCIYFTSNNKFISIPFQNNNNQAGFTGLNAGPRERIKSDYNKPIHSFVLSFIQEELS